MKNTHIRPMVLALTMVLTACGQSAPEKLAQAQESFERNDFVSARLGLISALQDEPDNQTMLKLLVKTQLALGDGEGAAASIAKLGPSGTNTELPELQAEADLLRGQFDKVLTGVAGRESSQAWRLRALANIGLGKTAAAREAFQKGMTSIGAKAELYASFARFELAAGSAAETQKLIKLALAENPDLIDGLLVSAQLAVRQGRLQDALGDFNRVLKISSVNSGAKLGKVGVLGDLGRLDEAGSLLKEVATQLPDDLRVIYLQARLASAQGRWKDVRTLLQPTERDMRENPRMQALYAQALLRMGLNEQARGWLVPLVRKYPGHYLARQLLGEAQLEGGDAAKALQTLRPLADRPDASPGQLSLAAKAAKLARDPSAERYAQRARTPAPEWVGGELAKADQSLRKGNWADAAARYQDILDRSITPNAIVLNNLAFATSNLGRQDEALALAMRALQLEPNHPSVMDTAGWLMIKTGQDRAKGIDLLRAAAKKAPDNPAIAKHLAAAVR